MFYYSIRCKLIIYFFIFKEIVGLEEKGLNGYKNGHIQSNYNFKRNNSDGSDRDTLDSEDTFYSDDLDSSNSLDNENDDDSMLPRLTVKNKYVRLDRITPKLINLMNEVEKENYINICRQLYTEIYEI